MNYYLNSRKKYIHMECSSTLLLSRVDINNKSKISFQRPYELYCEKCNERSEISFQDVYLNDNAYKRNYMKFFRELKDGIYIFNDRVFQTCP